MNSMAANAAKTLLERIARPELINDNGPQHAAEQRGDPGIAEAADKLIS